MPNFSLNFVPITVRNSLLAGMPTTTVPSFLAAVRVFSHSVCHSAAGETEGKLTNSSRTRKMANRLVLCIRHPSLSLITRPETESRHGILPSLVRAIHGSSGLPLGTYLSTQTAALRRRSLCRWYDPSIHAYPAAF